MKLVMMTTEINKKNFYRDLQAQVQALIADETDTIANMATIAAVLFEVLEQVNWVGFYRVLAEQLVVGPFQGKVACIRIPLGKGVCGTCVLTGEVQRIADVHQFDGHIACDASTNAELVIPVKVEGKVVAILDIDSRAFDRFDLVDEQGLISLVQAFEQNIAAMDNAHV